MMRKKITALPLFVFCLLFLAIETKSQPTQVQVQSITIKNSGASNSFSTLEIVTNLFTDQAGEAWGFAGLSRCLPCRSGETVGGSRSSTLGLRFGKSLGNGVTRYYQFDNGALSTGDFTLPYFAPKARQIKFFGTARLFGELKVYDQNQSGGTQLLYTANIDLTGSSKITFAPLSGVLCSAQTGCSKTSTYRNTEMIFTASQ